MNSLTLFLSELSLNFEVLHVNDFITINPFFWIFLTKSLSNLFNIFALGLIDSFYTEGRLLGVIDPTLALAGLMALLLTTLGLIGNLAREERRILFMEVDALLILIGYGAGIWLLYARGVFH